MLKRDISTTNILVASAGGMIGSGWLFSPFISAQMAGSNALISWVIAAVLQFPLDIVCFLPYSIFMLYLSQVLITEYRDDEVMGSTQELLA